MKKIISIIFILFMLSACINTSGKEKSDQERYLDMISLIEDNETFATSSNYFNIYAETSTGNEGYRFYVFIDTPRVAMYDVEVMAIEKGKDYKNTMAANLGILEETEYSFIPNQTNPNKGYYKGASISALTDRENPTLYVLVQWKNRDLSKLYREYIVLESTIQGEQ